MMLMKHRYSTKDNGYTRVYKTRHIGVRALPLNILEPGDKVYIAGNLVNNIPTAVYGPHEVVDPKKQLLRNITSDKTFYERYPLVYIKTD